MEESLLATREIMWKIPASFKVAMYIMFVASLAVLVKGLYDKFLYVRAAKENNLIPPRLQWGRFFQTVLLTGKVPRRPYVAVFHSMLYYGFIVLWIATDLVAI